MNKIISLLIVICLIFSVTGCREIEQATNNDLDKESTGENANRVEANSISYNSSDIDGFLILHKEELVEKYGNKYELTKIGPESHYEGYYYKNLGITFGFEESKLEYIQFDEGTIVDNINNEMSFDEVEKIKGEKEIEEGYEEDLTTKSYELVYEYDMFDMYISSNNSQGKNLAINVMRNAKIVDTTDEDINGYFKMNKDEFFNKMKGQYYDIVDDAGLTQDRTGYYFERLSEVFVFDESNQLELIEPRYQFFFNGTKMDTDLESIKTTLGNPSSQEVIDEANGINKAVYSFKEFTISCITLSKNSTSCNIYIEKN